MEGDNSSAACTALNEENSNTGGDNSNFADKLNTPEPMVELTTDSSSAAAQVNQTSLAPTSVDSASVPISEENTLSQISEGNASVPVSESSMPTQPSQEEKQTAAIEASYVPPIEEKQDGKLEWPTIGDLNTRLRRVITAYQKNFRKEEIKQLQKARVSVVIIKRK